MRKAGASRVSMSFSGDRSWPIVVSRDLLLTGEKFGQSSRFTTIGQLRPAVDETERLRQPAGAIEKTLGLFGHIGLFQMIDQLRRGFAFGFPNRLENAGLGD